MTYNVILRHNANTGVAPANGTLLSGEVAVNTTDKTLYIGDPNGNTVTLFSGGSTLGDASFATASGITQLKTTTTNLQFTPVTGANIILSGKTYMDKNAFVAGNPMFMMGYGNNAGFARDVSNNSVRIVGDASTSGLSTLVDIGKFGNTNPSIPGTWTSLIKADMGGNLTVSGNITANSNVSVTGTITGTGSLASISSSVPATNASAGSKGAIAYDVSYIYICVATNTWIRAARSAF
jgi:hypothetical protein